MAVTIYDEPQLISPAGNPLVFTFSSDQTAQPNFSFVVELYIDSTLRLTQEVFRQFNTLGRIDVSEAVQSTLTSPLVVDGTLTTFYDTAINGKSSRRAAAVAPVERATSARSRASRRSTKVAPARPRATMQLTHCCLLRARAQSTSYWAAMVLTLNGQMLLIVWFLWVAFRPRVDLVP